MQKHIFIIMMLTASFTRADPAQVAYDADSPAALEARAQAQMKYDRFGKEGRALLTKDIDSQLTRLDMEKKGRIALATKPSEVFAAAFVTTDDDMRAISYSTVLKERSDSGDPVASFYFGARQWNMCLQMEKQQSDIWAKQAKECWQEVLPAFKRASDAQIGDASFNIGKLYENGFGVMPSKLVAAEWYVKSANQYNKKKDRDEALTSVERALYLVPDHPAALRLKKLMLK